jgi:hypothetical protein
MAASAAMNERWEDLDPQRHPCEGRDPAKPIDSTLPMLVWVPTFVGMTE